MKQQRGLGRGLDSLFVSDKVEAKITPMSELSEIALDKISPNPTQPRRTIDEEQIEELTASIKELGIIQPITLKRDGGGRYTIISGERRWIASQRAGLTQIPAYVREVDDETMHAMALVENLQRENLNPIEIALGLQRLIDECSLTQEAMAQKVSMKRSSISNYLRLLKLSDEVQYALKQGFITMGHAKAIASVEREQARVELLKICVERAISVREAEMRAQQFNQTDWMRQHPKPKQELVVPVGFEGLSSRLEGIFSKGAQIKTNSRGGGKIVINFTSRSEIEQFIKELESER
ncbi:MAG: ParB/RepB/Spo0J family partition protein [Rikenellaceae bacterium]